MAVERIDGNLMWSCEIGGILVRLGIAWPFRLWHLLRFGVTAGLEEAGEGVVVIAAFGFGLLLEVNWS